MEQRTMTATRNARLPLYKKVTDQLREQCLESPGAMMPSLRQLSQTLNVNHATISRALSDLEREGIVEIVPRKGIFSIARAETNSNIELVVLCSEQANLLDVALRISEGMKNECEKLNARGIAADTSRTVLSVPAFPDADRFVAELRARGTAGVVLLGSGFFQGELAAQEEAFIAQLAQKMPVVLAGTPDSPLGLDCVYGDPHMQMQDFLHHCYDQGLRHFEYLGDHGDNLLQRTRREEFQHFLESKNLDWHWNDLRSLDGPPLVDRLRSETRFPEVVVATNIKRALTIALEAQRRGLSLPEEVHLLCFASLPEHAQPLLPYASVILLDEPGVGARAVQMLQERIGKNHDRKSVVARVPAHFISGPFYTSDTIATAA